MNDQSVDLMIVGGGINGVGIARDAVGRGLSVLLVEQADLASHTSSASTKLIHGGLRYLEHGEFRLVREALLERERLLYLAPHIIRPLRFVLPQHRSPRPAWLVRLGLFLYDHLARRRRLPGTEVVALAGSPLGEGLAERSGKGFAYSDCWVDDSRLVVLTALDAAERGAAIRTRTRFVGARREAGVWNATIADAGGDQTVVHARALVNAAGPWVSDLLALVPEARAARGVRLVKGSHIVVPRLYDGDHAFMLQNDDRRIVFAIPYEDRFTLVGTTDEDWPDPPAATSIGPAETDYLLATIARYFSRPIRRDEIAWSYAGIRPLLEDRAAHASVVSRDYELDVDASADRAPILSVFGGKITTHRKLAQHAMRKLGLFFPGAGGAWTADAPLPGGDLPGADLEALLHRLRRDYPRQPPELVLRLARGYGTRARRILAGAETFADLGIHFGGGLTSREVDYLVDTEWAASGEDVLFRRSKLGLHLDAGAARVVDTYVTHRMRSRNADPRSAAAPERFQARTTPS